MKHWDIILGYLLLGLIAFGTIWTAYESHVANVGVMAWQHEFSEIRSEGNASPEPSHAQPPVKSF